MTFKQLIKKRKELQSLLSESELEILNDLIVKYKPNTIVELGCMYGGTSRFIAEAMPKKSTFYCVDGFYINGEDAKRMFTENILDVFDNVKLIESSTREASVNFNEPIDFLFIDADHQADNVQYDCQNWLPKVKPGGLVAFHDYFNPMFPGVRIGVEDYTSGWETIKQADTLMVKVKPLGGD